MHSLLEPFSVRWADTARVARKKAAPQGDLPRLTSIPAARSPASVLKVRLYLVLGGLLLAAAAGLFAAFSWLTYQPPAVKLEDAVPRGQGLASIVAEAFLRGESLPVPVAADVPELPDDAVSLPHTPVEWTGFKRGVIAGTVSELHTFLFYRVEGQAPNTTKTLYQLNVLVAFTDRGTAVLGALPSFQPVIATNLNKSTVYTPDSADNLAPSQTEAIKTWSSAWAKNDSAGMAASAGAPPGFRYLGLGGFESTGVKVLSVTPLNPQSPSADQNFVVRSRVSLLSANGFKTSMDMDLLLKGAGDSRTYVLAWGPAGTGQPKEENVRVKE